MHIPTIFVWTHDSVGVGEDGPTHEPVEQTMALRAIPGLTIIRPADANEVAGAWSWVLTHHEPAGILLSRQGLPVLPGTKEAVADGRFARGAYILADAPDGRPAVILIATGSEVSLAMDTRARLAEQGVQARVISMPSWEIFEAQDEAYRENVLPAAVKARVSVEAGVTLGWQKWVGDAGASVGIDRFGASGKGPEVMAYLGITADHLLQEALRVLGR